MASLKGCLLFLASTPLAFGAIAGLRPIRRSLDPIAVGKNSTVCTYTVQGGDTAWDIANNIFVESFGLPELYRLNPGLEARVHDMRIGETLNVPCLERKLIPQPGLTDPCTREYIVQPNDTLEKISIKETVGVKNLKQWNNLNDLSVIVPGQRLCVSKSEPVDCKNHHVVVVGDTCEDIANAAGIKLPELARLNPDLLAVGCSILPDHRLCIAAGDKSPVAPVAPAGGMLPDPSQPMVPGETNRPSVPTTDNAVSPAGPMVNDAPGAIVPATDNTVSPAGTTNNAPGAVVPATDNAVSPAGTTNNAPGPVVPATDNMVGPAGTTINDGSGAVMPAAANINGATGARIGGAPGAVVPATANTASQRTGWAKYSANVLAQPYGASSDIRSISPALRLEVQMVVNWFIGNRTQPGQPNSKAVEMPMRTISAAILAAQSTKPTDVVIGRRQGGFIRYLVKVLLSAKVTVRNGVLQPAVPGTTVIESRNPAFDVRMALSVSVPVWKGGYTGAGASSGHNTIPQGGHGQGGASPDRNTVPQGGHGQGGASPGRNTVSQGGHGQPGASPGHNGNSASPDRAATNASPNHISVSQDVRIQAGGSPNSVSIDASTKSSPRKGTADGGDAVCH